LEAAKANDPARAEEITREIMQDSIVFWEIAERTLHTKKGISLRRGVPYVGKGLEKFNLANIDRD